jgi:hypothetical protein
MAILGAVAGVAASAPAHAGNIVEFGSAVRDTNNGPAEILVSVQVNGYASGTTDLLGPILGQTTLVWARFSVDMGVSVNGEGADSLIPSFKIDFIPVSTQSSFANDMTGGPFGDVRVLETTVERDIRINKSLGVNIKVAGIKASGALAEGRGLYFLAGLAVDALGYKYRNYENGSDFHGAKLAGLEASVGQGIVFNESFSITAMLVGKADVAFGGSNGFAVQSDMSTYAQLDVTLFEIFSLFIRGGFEVNFDTGNGNTTTLREFLAGIRFGF